MTDRACIRGCTISDVHYATCSGLDDTRTRACRGCAPRECRDRSLICDKCFGRIRYLLDNLTDLEGRLTAKADPLTASPLDQIRIRATSTDLPAAQDSDILDALAAIRSVPYVEDLRTWANDRDAITWLAALILDRHKPVNGIREAWSVQDAVDTWGLERKTDTYVYPDDEDPAPEHTPVTEWFDPMLTKTQAERAAGSARTLRRWVEKGLIQPHGRLNIGGVITPWYRASEIQSLRETMRDRISRNQYKTQETT